MKRNIGLDLLRSVAILTVLLGHAVNSYGSPPFLAPLQFGGTGVDLFFVLSGWLIGTQLFDEQREHGSIELRRFWLRRWMRTLPAYYSVLALTIFQHYLTKPDFSFPWQHIFFLQNYMGDQNIFFVSWSLCVEEQFYLLVAPFAGVLMTIDKRFRLPALILLLLMPTLFRAIGMYETTHEAHVRIDCCVMGVLLAYLREYSTKLFDAGRLTVILLLTLSTSAYLFFYINRYVGSELLSEPSKLVLAVVFGTWVFCAACSYNWQPSGLLRATIMHVSTRSYAMYLLHVEALAITNRIASELGFIGYASLALLITMVVSEVLYRLVELPFMLARSRFELTKNRDAATFHADTAKTA